MGRDPYPPPADLDQSARALFRRLRGFLRELDKWHDGDAEALGQACRWAQRARDAREQCVDEDGRPTLTALGYKGQVVKHPNLLTAETAERSYFDALVRLGFTASGRAKLGIADAGPRGRGRFGDVFG